MKQRKIMLKINSSLFWIVLIVLGISGPVLAQQPSPTEKTAWIEKLSQIKETPTQGLDYQTLFALLRAEPEMIYAVMHDGWSSIPRGKAKIHLMLNLINNNGVVIRLVQGRIEETGQLNPHLLEMVDLGAMDSDSEVRQATYQALYTIAYEDIA